MSCLTFQTIAEIAARQLADYDAHQPGRAFEDAAFNLSTSEAYAVQGEVAALRLRRGEGIAGYKIGCVSEAVQRQLGINAPVFGHLFKTEIYPSGTVIDAERFCTLAIEGEIAVRIGSGSSITAIFPVIELHNNLLRAAVRNASELIANNALHAGFVLPAREAPYTDAECTGLAAISVFRGGTLLGSATGNEILGGPAASVAKVSQHLASFGEQLRPGQVILTGSPLPLYPVRLGDHVVVRGANSLVVELSIGGAPEKRI